jgi:hypothetical protein
LVINDKEINNVKKFIEKNFNSINLIYENSGSLKYKILNNNELCNFLESIENKKISVEDWYISQTSLEDVFLSITKEIH